MEQWFAAFPLWANLLVALGALYLLMRAAALTVAGAVAVAIRLTISPLLIGTTIVAMSTSLVRGGPSRRGMDRRVSMAAEMAKLAALARNAGVVPAQAIKPPARDAPMICTRRPLDQATELAASDERPDITGLTGVTEAQRVLVGRVREVLPLDGRVRIVLAVDPALGARRATPPLH